MISVMIIMIVPFYDDEFLCGLHHIKCPFKCNCLSFGIECYQNHYQFLSLKYPYIFITFSKMYKLALAIFREFFPDGLFIKLLSNKIAYICGNYFPVGLQFLDLSFNIISHIDGNCLLIYHSLKILIFEYNNLTFLRSTSLRGLFNLILLNLSNNPMVTLSANIFFELHMARVMYLQNVQLLYISINSFKTNNFNLIVTNDYRICCLTIHTSICTGNRPWYRTCNELLPTKEMVIMFIIVSVLILISNIFSAVVYIRSEYSNRAFIASVCFINCNELLLLAYICILWIANFKLQDTIMVGGGLWRSGLTCFSAFELLLCYSFLSILGPTFLSVSRLLVILYPMNSEFKRLKFSKKFILCSYVMSFVITLFFTTVVKLTNGFLPTNMCIPFADPTKVLIMHTFFIWILVVSHCITLTTILLVHITLVRNLKRSSEHMRKSNLENLKANLVIQLVIMTTSNFFVLDSC